MRVKIVTLNAGLLTFFWQRLIFAPFVRERARALPEHLRTLDADIIALQEVYHQKHRERIIAGLRDIYPFAAYSPKRRSWGMENGLMVLSKWPVTAELELFRDGPWDERLGENKGFLTANIAGINGGLRLINVHTTAGGMYLHPEGSKTNRFRARQLRQMLSADRSPSELTLVVGDLNAGPGASEENFVQVLDAGFTSVYDMLNGHDGECTWDPLNRLNRESRHKTSPPQRLDHFFVRTEDLQSGRISPVDCGICCQEEVVPISSDVKVTVSDHFGLSVNLVLNH